MHPPVTAVSQPTYEFGRQAVEQVMRLIDDAESGPVDTVMATSFVDRETCGCRRPIGANLAKRSPTAEPALEETH